MNKAKAWFIAARPFAIPYWVTNVALGVALAGWNLNAFIVAASIVTLIGLSAHFTNNWRDYVKGVDTLEDGSKPKAYTPASQLLPRGILTVKDMKIATVFCLLIAFLLAGIYLRRLDQIIIFLIGVFAAVAYTDLLKPKGFGEVAMFIGFAMSSAFGYTMIKPFDYTAFATVVVTGMIPTIAYTIDQLPDVETDLARRIKNLSYYVFKANISISSILWFAVTATFTLIVGFIVVGWLPQEMLIMAATLPLWHISGIIVDNDLEKGIVLALVAYFLYLLLPTVFLLL